MRLYVDGRLHGTTVCNSSVKCQNEGHLQIGGWIERVEDLTPRCPPHPGTARVRNDFFLKNFSPTLSEDTKLEVLSSEGWGCTPVPQHE